MPIIRYDGFDSTATASWTSVGDGYTITCSDGSIVTGGDYWTATASATTSGLSFYPAEPVFNQDIEDDARRRWQERQLQQQRAWEYEQRRRDDHERRRRELEEASERAEQLLLDNLSERERRRWSEYGSILVHGSVGGLYLIARGHVRNITRISKQQAVETLCAHGPTYLPTCDQVLLQKLHLETDEPSFLRIANRSMAGHVNQHVLDE